MIIHYTPDEIREKAEIENKYNKLLKEAEKLIENLEPKGKPNTEQYFDGLDPIRDSEKWEQALKKEEQNLTAWMELGTPEWHEARNHYYMLQDSYVDELNRFTRKCEQRQFAELGGDPRKIENDFKAQVQETISNLYNSVKEDIENLAHEGGGLYQSNYVINTGAGTWKLNPVTVRQNLLNGLQMYFDFCNVRNSNLGIVLKNYLNNVLIGDNHFSSSGNMAIKKHAIKVEAIVTKNTISKLDGQRVKEVTYPIDKINNTIWKNLEVSEGNGQYGFLTLNGNNKDVEGVALALDFDALENIEGVKISKQLLPYDKRVYVAVSALNKIGNECMTCAQILHAMGIDYNVSPSKDQRDKLYNSLTKMLCARISINNATESKTTKGKYKLFTYDGLLLPFERMSEVEVNGRVSDFAIRLLREPPLYSFAREREQITTISRDLLATPLSLTDKTIVLEDYLIWRISSYKNMKKKDPHFKKIDFETLYSQIGAKTRKDKFNARNRLPIILEHYKKTYPLKSYKVTDTYLEFDL